MIDTEGISPLFYQLGYMTIHITNFMLAFGYLEEQTLIKPVYHFIVKKQSGLFFYYSLFVPD